MNFASLLLQCTNTTVVYCVLAVILQERPLALAGRFPDPLHVLGNGRFGSFVAEFQQLSMNTRRAPNDVLGLHFSDEAAQLGIDRWPPASATLPRPVSTKALPMPAHDGIGI